MKRILYITSNKIYDNAGGGIGQRKIYEALSFLEQDALISFDTISLDNFKNNVVILKKKKFYDILSRFFIHSNYIYIYKRKICSLIKSKKYDIIVLGNSRLGSLVKKYYKDIKIVTHFDNVEFDYCKSAYQNSNLLKKMFGIIESIVVKRDEKISLKVSDKIACLSKRDYFRLKDLYGYDKNYCIYPVCVKMGESLEPAIKSKLLFIGSLNYASNIAAIKDFMPIFMKQNFFDKIVIAGSNPSKNLLNYLTTNDRVVFKPNFKKYSDIASKGDILVSFIKKGAGMKVKVAEAMSMGLLVIGSDETFIGYEELFNKDLGLYICNNEEEYMKSLQYLSNLDITEIQKLSNKNIDEFEKNFSIKKSIDIIKEIIYE